MLGVSSENYEHARKVWKVFGIRNLGEYHDLYFKTDVILLANVFKVFRKVCLKNYGLDPAHFYMAPGLASKEAYLKTVMKPNFKSGVLFGENLMGCEMGKVKVVMNKPIYLG